MKSNRFLFQLAPSVLRTDENGSGLLPTITTQEIEHPKAELTKTGRRATKDKRDSHSVGVADTIALLPTPIAGTGTWQWNGSRTKKTLTLAGMIPTLKASDGLRGRAQGNERGRGADVNDVLAMLPTPTTRDWKGTRKPETLAAAGRTVTNSLEDALVGTNRGYKLQPAFAAWMMGYPENYTELPFQNGEKKV